MTVLALALSGSQALHLLEDDAAHRLDDAPLAFTVVGSDRLTEGPPSDRTLDPGTAVAVLSARTQVAAFLLAASPVRDHPYNLARRIASVGHLSGGRTGVVVGGGDPYVPDGAGRSRGGGPVLTAPGVPGAVRDVARGVQKLEQTWPWDAVVADRERRIFARGDRIRYAHHGGVLPTAGPLTLPGTPEGSSVLAWWVTSADEVDVAAGVADVLIVPPDLVAEAAGTAHRPLILVALRVDGTTGIDEVRSGSAGADGVVLQPVEDDVTPLLRDLRRWGIDRPAAGTLRERLGLPPAPDLLPEGPGVFAEPVAVLLD